MTRSHKLPALLFALCACASVAHAKDDGHDKDRAFITKAYADVDKAIKNKDADSASAYIAEDYVSINRDGKEDVHGKAEEIALVRKIIAYAPDATTQITVSSVSFDKQGATVLNTDTFTGTITHNGEKHVLSITGTYRDLWVKSGDGWLEKRSQSLTETSTMDGKPVVVVARPAK